MKAYMIKMRGAVAVVICCLLLFGFVGQVQATIQPGESPPLTSGVHQAVWTGSTSRCTGSPFIEGAGGKCNAQSGGGTAMYQILFMSNKTVYGSATTGYNPYTVYGIDCSDPNAVKLRFWEGNVTCHTNPTTVVALEVILPPGEDGSDFCVQSPVNSFSLQCPPTPSPPTQSPTASPSQLPTALPSQSPTPSPSQSPTASPSESPTASPSQSPTPSPSRSPTASPSESPTASPSHSPTPSPSQSPTASPSTQSPTVCVPHYKMTKRACQRRIRQCRNNIQSTGMKWTGPGCKIGRKKMGDGRCQCRGYCGYTCKKACKRDRECKWEAGACYKKSGQLGEPISTCTSYF